MMDKFDFSGTNFINYGKWIDTQRNLGYTLAAALREFIDNSQGADSTKITIGIDGRGTKVERIFIGDNGIGMSLDQLVKCLTFGTPKEDRNVDVDLGFYGMGCKTGAISQGKKLTIVTTQNGKTLVGELDVELIKAKNKILPNFREATSEELKLFTTYANRKDGTLVILSDLDRCDISKSKFKELAEGDLVDEYYQFRNKINFVLKLGDELTELQPYCNVRDRSEKQFGPIDFLLEGEEKITVEIHAVSSGNLPKNKKRKDKTSKTMKNSGFTVVRNGRIVARGIKIYTPSKHPKSLRGVIYYNGGSDAAFNARFTKDGISLSDKAEYRFKSNVNSLFNKYLTYMNNKDEISTPILTDSTRSNVGLTESKVKKHKRHLSNPGMVSLLKEIELSFVKHNQYNKYGDVEQFIKNLYK